MRTSERSQSNSFVRAGRLSFLMCFPIQNNPFKDKRRHDLWDKGYRSAKRDYYERGIVTVPIGTIEYKYQVPVKQQGQGQQRQSRPFQSRSTKPGQSGAFRVERPSRGRV